MSSRMDSGSSSERLHALDLVRAGALLAGIVYHASLSMLPGVSAWLVMDVARSPAVAALTFILHSFRMATFFLLAGYFGRMVLLRRGTGAFVSDRVRRILVPFAIFLAAQLALFAAALFLGVQTGAVTLGPGFSLWNYLSPANIPLLHLWFLYVLLILYAAMLGLHRLAEILDPDGRLRAGVDRVFGWLLGGFRLPALLALPAAALLLLQPGWLEFWGVIAPDTGLLPAPAPLGIYFLALGCGWMLHRQNGALASLARHWAGNLATACVASAAALWMVGTQIVPAPLFAGGERIVYACLYGAMMWFWTFAAIGAALRFLRRPNRTARYLADTSYWLSLIHLPLVMGLQMLVAPWPLPAPAKLALVVAAAMMLMLASYQWLVRDHAIGRMLSGRKRPGRVAG